jgi:mannitol-1-phosphate 5-dehydrogenase
MATTTVPTGTSRRLAPASRARGRAVIIGPGKIGCGYLAPLFAEAGWDVVLAARSADVVARIRAAGDFTVRITGHGGVQRVGAEAVLIGSDAFNRAVADADVLLTAVGSGSVDALGDPLARALATGAPQRPIDVWAVENGDVAPILEAAVRQAAARRGLGLPPVGFAGAIPFAAVTQGDWNRSSRPEFVGDACRWLLIDGARLLRPLPRLPRVGITTRYHEHLRTKRFIFSAGHALCAYLGVRRGHRFIHEAAGDPLLRPLIAGSLAASQRALIGARADGAGQVEWVLQRYANAELWDPLPRVAREPLRKLSAEGPLVGPAQLVAQATGRVPAGFAAGIASALVYRHADDPQSWLLADLLEDGGVAAVLSDVSGLDPLSPLAREVMRLYERYTRGEPRPVRRVSAAALCRQAA